jgi:hypothetical protein
LLGRTPGDLGDVPEHGAGDADLSVPSLQGGAAGDESRQVVPRAGAVEEYELDDIGLGIVDGEQAGGIDQHVEPEPFRGA